jgi:hypothetical protein
MRSTLGWSYSAAGFMIAVNAGREAGNQRPPKRLPISCR